MRQSMRQSDQWNLGGLVAVVIGLVLGSCAAVPPQQTALPQPTAVPAPVPVDSPPPAGSAETASYDEALALATGAVKLGQQAQSVDDWDLVANRWQRAIAQLQAVPAGHPNHAAAQTKIADYERNLAYAQQRLTQLKNPPPQVPLPAPTDPAPSAPAAILNTQRFSVPILTRRGGTPVISVTFNGGQSFPMILDTGASHTHLPRSVASQLGVEIIGQATAATASDRSAVIDIGRVSSITVGGITRSNVAVSVGDAVEVGLLGNDFHDGYDIVLQANRVEFIRR